MSADVRVSVRRVNIIEDSLAPAAAAAPHRSAGPSGVPPAGDVITTLVLQLPAALTTTFSSVCAASAIRTRNCG